MVKAFLKSDQTDAWSKGFQHLVTIRIAWKLFRKAATWFYTQRF